MTASNRPIQTLHKSKSKKPSSKRAIFLFFLMIVLIISGSFILRKDHLTRGAYERFLVEEEAEGLPEDPTELKHILISVESYTTPGRLNDKEIVYLAVMTLDQEEVRVQPVEVKEMSSQREDIRYQEDLKTIRDELEQRLDHSIQAFLHIDLSDLRSFVEAEGSLPITLTRAYNGLDLTLPANEVLEITPRQADLLSYPLEDEETSSYHERIQDLLAACWKRIDGVEEVWNINGHIEEAEELIQTNIPYKTFRTFYLKDLLTQLSVYIQEPMVL